MSANSKIEWTDSTWNVVTGCTPIREGCANCYAKRMATRLGGRCEYPADDPFMVTMHPDKFSLPFKWKKPRTIFVCSMGDLFHKDVSESSIKCVFITMANTQHHTYIVLTKRPERMKCLIKQWKINGLTLRSGYGCFLPNVILGVSISTQRDADDFIPYLLETPAARRVVSAEPLLENIDFSEWLFCDSCNEHPDPRWGKGAADDPLSNAAGGRPWADCYTCSDGGFPKIDWVICGGETGAHARPMHPDWARSIRDQCQASGTPFFFKGWGDRYQPFTCNGELPSNCFYLGIDGAIRPGDHEDIDYDACLGTFSKKNCSKESWKNSKRQLDGRTWDERPR